MNTPTAPTLDSVRAGLSSLDDLTAFAVRYRLPLRTLVRMKSPSVTGARQKNLEKVAKALNKHQSAAAK